MNIGQTKMGVQKRENKPLNTHNETNPKMEKAENPCSARIIGERIRSIVSIPMVSKLSTLFGPSGETRTRGILVPNQAPYQLGHTRILSYEKILVVVKYVVKEILPQFCPTFNGSNQGYLRR